MLSDGEKLFRAFGQFEAALRHIELYGERHEALDEATILARKKSFAEGYLNVLRKSLFYDYIIDCVGEKERSVPNIYPDTGYALPSCVYRDVNMRDKCILVNYRKPWSIAAQCIKLQSNESLKGERYFLYKNLGIGYPSHGNHRIISASMNDYDLIADEVEVLDDTAYLNELEVRGMQWYKKSGAVPLGNVADYRIALIFRILQYCDRTDLFAL